MTDRVVFRVNRQAVFTEGARVLTEIASLMPASPFLYQAPRGDGHPVLVLPGFGAGDGSTGVLRSFLSSIGYRSHPWNLGTNRGPGMSNLLTNLADRLDDVFSAAGERKVSLVGWSLGGVYARLLAHHHPHKVRQVITLGSPITVGSRPSASRARLLAGEPLPGIPSTAVFSKSDAIVPWQIATQQPTEFAENVEVYASHIGLGFNPAVLYAAADRLANRDGEWRHFQRSGWKRLVYGPAELATEEPSRARSYESAAAGT